MVLIVPLINPRAKREIRGSELELPLLNSNIFPNSFTSSKIFDCYGLRNYHLLLKIFFLRFGFLRNLDFP